MPPFTSIAEHRERGMAYESIPGLLAQSRGDGHFHRSSRGSRGGARCASHHFMCNPYSITTNQAAIIGSTARSATRRRCRAYFRTTLIRNTDAGTENCDDALGHAAAAERARSARHQHPPHWRGWLKPENRCPRDRIWSMVS